LEELWKPVHDILKIEIFSKIFMINFTKMHLTKIKQFSITFHGIF